jgi:hypothetical protein
MTSPISFHFKQRTHNSVITGIIQLSTQKFICYCTFRQITVQAGSFPVHGQRGLNVCRRDNVISFPSIFVLFLGIANNSLRNA